MVLSRPTSPSLEPSGPRYRRIFFATMLLLSFSFLTLLLASQRAAICVSAPVAVELNGADDGLRWRSKATEDSSKEQRLPSCIIIGVRKGGTRALLEFLNLHPGIEIAKEEVHFFDRRYSQGYDFYRSKMPLSRSDQVTVEKSPAYFISPRVPQLVRAMNDSIRLILILRDPTTRVISDYTQVLSNRLAKNRTMPPLRDLVLTADGHVNEAFKAVQISRYHEHLRNWLVEFPRRQLHIVDGDRLIRDPFSEVWSTENFLGLPHLVNSDLFSYNNTRGFYCIRKDTTDRCLASSKGRKHPPVEPTLVRTLQRYFKPHNSLLFRMIGRTFDWP